MREIVFDVETTGLEPLAGDRITEIGAVEIIDYIPTGRTFQRYLNPERDIPAKVVEVTGLTAAFLADKPKFAEVVDAFLDFVGDARLVAHNAGFDRGFINAELTRSGRPPFADGRFFDTLELARTMFPGAYNSLDALCKRFEISLDARQKHGALLDSRLLAEVYLRLNGGRERNLALEPTAPTRSRRRDRPLLNVRPDPLPPAITEDERAAHAAFIESLGPAALWRQLEAAAAASGAD